MTDPLDFSDRTVIVTGGCRGIGRVIAERFLGAGAAVVVCCRNHPDDPIAAEGREAVFVAADVRQPDDIATVVHAATDATGRLDVLINNAGGAPLSDAATASPRFTSSVIELNLVAAINFAQAAQGVMRDQPDGGAIVNVGSVSGMRPSPGTAAYGAAKAGLISVTASLAVEWAPRVRINTVSAGLIQTEAARLHYGNEAAVDRVAETVPLGRLGTPGDVADACLFLASSLASYITGANLVVHGGGEAPAFLAAVRGDP